MRGPWSHHQCTITTVVCYFRTVTIGTYFRDSMSSGNTTVSTGRKPVPEPFSGQVVLWSSRIEKVGEYAQHVRSCLAVGHLGERLGHLAKDRGDVAPCLRIKACEFIQQRRRRRLRVGHEAHRCPFVRDRSYVGIVPL